MIVIDKSAFTRYARALRREAAVYGIQASHSVFLEAAAASLGFDDINKATAVLRERAIVVGVNLTGCYLQKVPVSNVQVIRHAVRLLSSWNLAGRVGDVDLAAKLVEGAIAVGIDHQAFREIDFMSRHGFNASGNFMSFRHMIQSHLKKCIQVNRADDTSWADMDTFHPAFRIGSADAELDLLKTRCNALDALEAGSLVTPDLRFEWFRMMDAFKTRMDLRIGKADGTLVNRFYHHWLDIWAPAFRDEILGIDGDLENEMLTRIVLNAMQSEEAQMCSGRWARIDCVMASVTRSMLAVLEHGRAAMDAGAPRP